MAYQSGTARRDVFAAGHRCKRQLLLIFTVGHHRLLALATERHFVVERTVGLRHMQKDWLIRRTANLHVQLRRIQLHLSSIHTATQEECRVASSVELAQRHAADALVSVTRRRCRVELLYAKHHIGVLSAVGATGVQQSSAATIVNCASRNGSGADAIGISLIDRQCCAQSAGHESKACTGVLCLHNCACGCSLRIDAAATARRAANANRRARGVWRTIVCKHQLIGCVTLTWQRTVGTRGRCRCRCRSGAVGA